MGGHMLWGVGVWTDVTALESHMVPPMKITYVHTCDSAISCLMSIPRKVSQSS